MPHLVYILYSPSSDKFYTGSTSNVDETLKRHNAGLMLQQNPEDHGKLYFSKISNQNQML